MPEEEKLQLESTDKFEKDIYLDSKVLDKFWVEDSNSIYGKPAKAKLGTLILKECDEEVFLMMERHCCTEDLVMEGEDISDGSDACSFNDETVKRFEVIDEELNVEDLDANLSSDEENPEENKFYQDVNKQAEEPNPESKSSQDERVCYDQEFKLQNHENESIFSTRNEVEESIHVIQQQSGSIPYSGSISLRSTSSTASTQSFAFPILAQEWNSSPVRMAKPAKRLLSNRKLWRLKSWLCCKF